MPGCLALRYRVLLFPCETHPFLSASINPLHFADPFVVSPFLRLLARDKGSRNYTRPRINPFETSQPYDYRIITVPAVRYRATAGFNATCHVNERIPDKTGSTCYFWGNEPIYLFAGPTSPEYPRELLYIWRCFRNRDRDLDALSDTICLNLRPCCASCRKNAWLWDWSWTLWTYFT